MPTYKDGGSQFKAWPKGALPKAEHEERQAKMYNKYMGDAIESQKAHEAQIASEKQAMGWND